MTRTTLPPTCNEKAPAISLIPFGALAHRYSPFSTLFSLILNDQTSETPRASALRFCTPNLRKIESALGLDLHVGVGENGDDDIDASQEGGSMSEGRQSLREACTAIVEDAINAVLLGLRERVCMRWKFCRIHTLVRIVVCRPLLQASAVAAR